jgi:hypothetical protein
VRGVTATEVAGDPTTLQSTTPFLVRTAGAEIGARTKISAYSKGLVLIFDMLGCSLTKN